MGFIGSFLGKVAGEAAMQGAEVAKQKLSEKKAEIDEYKSRLATAKTMNAAFRLPKDYCEGANGKVWRVTQISGDNVYLHIKVSGGKEYNQWFDVRKILDYYEDL